MQEHEVCLATPLILRGEDAFFYRCFSDILELYQKVFVILKPGTSREVLSFIESHGEQAIAAFASTWKRARREALGMALAGGASYIHHCDADRLLHWFMHYPDELKQTIGQIPTYDYLIMGRTERAFKTHPLTMQKTEVLINHVFKLVYTQDVDIMTGSKGLSARAARWILERTQVKDVFAIDSEWPLLVRQRPQFTMGYVVVEGLEWETPDRLYAQGKDEQTVQAWKERLEASPEEWVHRLRMALSISEAVLPFVEVKKLRSKE